MRKTELLKIQKQDIDFFKRTIIVQSAKSHKLRVVHIDLKLTVILFVYCFKLHDEDFLFVLDSRYVSATFYNIIKKSKLQKICFHDLRHIYASYILSKSKNKANTILSVSHQLRSFKRRRNSSNIFSCS